MAPKFGSSNTALISSRWLLAANIGRHASSARASLNFILRKVASTLPTRWWKFAIRPKPPSNKNNEPPLLALIQGGDPAISKLRSSDPKFIKVLDAIDKGQAQKAVAADSADFLRAALPLIAGNHTFILGTMEEQRGFNWIVPPDEPVEKTDDKTRPPSAPSLRKKPTP